MRIGQTRFPACRSTLYGPYPGGKAINPNAFGISVAGQGDLSPMPFATSTLPRPISPCRGCSGSASAFRCRPPQLWSAHQLHDFSAVQPFHADRRGRPERRPQPPVPDRWPVLRPTRAQASVLSHSARRKLHRTRRYARDHGPCPNTGSDRRQRIRICRNVMRKQIRSPICYAKYLNFQHPMALVDKIRITCERQ